MQNNNRFSQTLQPGEVYIEGDKLYAFNLEHKETRCIGTIRRFPRGAVYSKDGQILRWPEPSLCFSESEFSAILSSGVEFVHIQVGDALYAIDLQRFAMFGKPFHNAKYGRQVRLPLTRFQRTNQDDWVNEQPGPLAPRERSTQLLDR